MKRLSVNVRLSVCEESNYIPKEHHKTNATYDDKDLINLHTLLVTENLDKH